MAPRSIRRGLWSDRNFALLWSGAMVSNVGSTVTSFALPLAVVVTVRGTPAQLALVVTVQGAASLAASFVAGVAVAGRDPRRIMIGLDAVRGAAGLLAMALGMTSHLSLAHLIALAALLSFASVLFGTAEMVLVPTLVGRSHLTEANAGLSSATAVALFAGPIVAGVVSQVWSPPVALGVDGATYLVSAATLMAIRSGPHQTGPDMGAARSPRILQSFLEGWSWSMRNARVRGMLLCTLGTVFFTSMAGGVAMSYRANVLHMSAALIGLLGTVTSPAFLLGPFLVAPLVKRMGLPRTIAVSAFVFGLGSAALPLARGSMAAIVATLIVGGILADASTMVFHTGVTIGLQQEAPDALLALVAPSRATLSNVAALIGPLAAAVLAQAIDVRSLLWVAAAGVMLSPSALVIAAWADRRGEEAVV